MRPVVDAAKVPAVDVAVDLRRRERAVPEQLLDHAQVGAALEQVRGERMAEAVRMGHEPSERARVQAAAAGGDEERVLGACDEFRPAVTEVEPDPVGGLLAERDDPLLLALAADVDRLGVEVDVREVEPDGLVAAQAC